MFKGSSVAIITPFKDDKIDEACLRKLVDFHIKNGTASILSCGTTGESATLSVEEHEQAIRITIEQADKKIPVIAGTGSNSTKEAIILTKDAAKLGANASLQVAPYYNKPTQKGLYEHFKAIADSVDIPIILYNIPSRTGINIMPETIAKLDRDCKNIVAVKEASGSLDQMSKIRSLCSNDFELVSGDDALTLPVMGIGGVGVISVVANIVPKEVADMTSAFKNGQIDKAQEIHYRLLPLVKAMFIETNPIPVKTAMGLLNMCNFDLRLPMCAMLKENEAKLKEALKNYGLLK
ncbi:MAG: 4-hydroxy-tetrahydrodipicolinate synthase [Candidatus Gygaella obscura]|nr:4-hydroxy-tetrahydrodipicolinate synthase [Candidatus Gygaella obscura]